MRGRRASSSHPPRSQSEQPEFFNRLIGVKEPAGFFAGLTQRLQKTFTIQVVPENRLPLIAARHDVVRRPGIFNAQRPGHSGWEHPQGLPPWQTQTVTIPGLTL